MESSRGEHPDSSLPNLAALESHSDVRDVVERARMAAAELRWHPAVRRRWRECRFEAGVWSAQAMASRCGVRAPIGEFRAAFVGPPQWSDRRLGAICSAAVRVCAAAGRSFSDLDQVTRNQAPTRSVLARLHSVIGAEPALGLGQPGRVGRPASPEASARIGRLAEAVDGAPPSTPAIILAAIALAELSAKLFAGGNTLVAEGFHWVLTVARGADPTGVAVPVRYRAARADRTHDLLVRYRADDMESVAAWVCSCAKGFIDGVAWGKRIADSIQAGVELVDDEPATS